MKLWMRALSLVLSLSLILGAAPLRIPAQAQEEAGTSESSAAGSGTAANTADSGTSLPAAPEKNPAPEQDSQADGPLTDPVPQQEPETDPIPQQEPETDPVPQQEPQADPTAKPLTTKAPVSAVSTAAPAFQDPMISGVSVWKYSAAVGSETPDNLFDTDHSLSKWCAESADGWVVFYLNGHHNITGMQAYHAGNSTNQWDKENAGNTKSYALQVYTGQDFPTQENCQDDSMWLTVGEETNNTDSIKATPVSMSSPAKIYRLKVTDCGAPSTATAIRIYGLELYGTKAQNTSALQEITIQTPPSRTTYLAGETFDPAGMEVLASYADGSSHLVTGWQVVNGSLQNAGTQNVEISYTEQGITKYVLQSVTVEEQPSVGPDGNVFGPDQIKLDPGMYLIPGFFMDANHPTKPSLIKSVLKDTILEVTENGPAYVSMNLNMMTTPVSCWVSDWKVYTEYNMTSPTIPAQILSRDAEGNVHAVRFTLPYQNEDGVFCNFFVSALGAANNVLLQLDYSQAKKISAPVITPAGGSYSDLPQVTIEGSEGEKIYYTLDGSEPTASSTLYEGPLTLSGDQVTLKAAAVIGAVTGPTATAEFIKQAPLLPGDYLVPVLELACNTNFLAPLDAAISTSLGSHVKLTAAEDGSITITAMPQHMTFIVNGGEYHANILMARSDMEASYPGSKQEIASTSFGQPEQTATLDVPAVFTLPLTAYSEASGGYPLEITVDFMNSSYGSIDVDHFTNAVLKLDLGGAVPFAVPAMPEITPNGGAIYGPATVTITGTPGAELRYTLDGNQPDFTSPKYEGPFTVSGTTTVKAAAFFYGSVSPAAQAVFEKQLAIGPDHTPVKPGKYPLVRMQAPTHINWPSEGSLADTLSIGNVDNGAVLEVAENGEMYVTLSTRPQKVALTVHQVGNFRVYPNYMDPTSGENLLIDPIEADNDPQTREFRYKVPNPEDAGICLSWGSSTIAGTAVRAVQPLQILFSAAEVDQMILNLITGPDGKIDNVITLEEEAQILEARKQYEALSDQEKAKVQNLSHLLYAETELKLLNIYLTMSLSVDDRIGMRIHLPDEAWLDINQVSVDFKAPNKPLVTVPGAQAQPAQGKWVFTFPMVTKEIADKVDITVHLPNSHELKKTLSIADYSSMLLNSGALTAHNAKLEAVLIAMLNYGSAAQTHFGYNSKALANAELQEAQKQLKSTAETFQNYVFTKPAAISGISYYGSSLNLISRVEMRHYFKLNEGETIENFRFSLNDFPLNPVKDSQGLYYVSLDELYAAKMEQTFTVTITNTGTQESMDLVYGPYTYANRAIAKDSSLSQVLFAMADFSTALREYALGR